MIATMLWIDLWCKAAIVKVSLGNTLFVDYSGKQFCERKRHNFEAKKKKGFGKVSEINLTYYAQLITYIDDGSYVIRPQSVDIYDSR